MSKEDTRNMRLFTGVLVLWFALCIALFAVQVATDDTSVDPDAGPVVWNMQPMSAAPESLAKKVAVSRILPIEWADVPKSLPVRFVGIQNERVLVLFGPSASSFGFTYACVFGVDGAYQYGYRYRATPKIRTALSPYLEGILLLDWRIEALDIAAVLALKSDGSRAYLCYRPANPSASEDYAVWKSDYRLIESANNRVVIADERTGEEVVLFDCSDEYLTDGDSLKTK